MAAAAAGIFGQHMTAAQELAGRSSPLTSNAKTEATSGSGGTTGSNSDSSTDSATISANDFLTLLVTEMQNQDPTADTDPNEYIDQLVQVNSLEQLIDINQTLTTDSTTTTGSSTKDTQKPDAATAQTDTDGSAMSPTARTAEAARRANDLGAVQGTSGANGTDTQPAVAQAAAAQYAPGNLSVPTDRPAAEGVARALDGRWHAHR